ncbi:hypothetical protein ES708_29183 [subsurface metagenome]
MHRRCVNNFYGYCTGTPQCKQSVISLGSEDSPQNIKLNSYAAGQCSENPLECKHFLTWPHELESTQALSPPG